MLVVVIAVAARWKPSLRSGKGEVGYNQGWPQITQRSLRASQVCRSNNISPKLNQEHDEAETGDAIAGAFEVVRNSQRTCPRFTNFLTSLICTSRLHQENCGV